MTTIKFGYAINQWKPQFDDFVRREEHERALKTMSIAGFTGVELTAGTGRWEPLGNPQQLAANFGSPSGFRAFLGEIGIGAVCSWFYDPEQGYFEDLSSALSPLVPADTAGIVAKAQWFSKALAELGGEVLAVRAAPSAGDCEPLDEVGLEQLAKCWNEVGAATQRDGVRTALHVDFLSALRRPGALDALLALTDPTLVGLAIDTGELTVAGIDPVALINRYPDRIWHVQFKDALALDKDDEYLLPHALYSVRQRGGDRQIPRWFSEPGSDDGAVDFEAVTRSLVNAGYTGWIVFETDQSPHPAASALLGGYYLGRHLLPLMTQAAGAESLTVDPPDVVQSSTSTAS